MGWNSYNLDRKAQELVLKYRDTGVLNQSHKMRLAVPYGLERFWGEHFRLIKDPKTETAGQYWKDTWDKLVEVMELAHIEVPNDAIDYNNGNNTQQINDMARQLWGTETFTRDDRQITLDVLTQLCDSLVWWTQRYKKKGESQDEPDSQAADEA